MACARWEGNQGALEGEVGGGEVERGGEVFGHVADSERKSHGGWRRR